MTFTGSEHRQSGSTAVWLWTGGLIALAVAAPHFLYPVFIMKVLCYAMLAASLNLLLGYVGLLSFGHAMFFGAAAYVCAHVVKVWGWDVTLGPNQYFVVGARLERERTLGQTAFTESGVQRLLVIRNCRSVTANEAHGILVTGGGGFLGHHVLEILTERGNADVIAPQADGV